MNDTQMTIVGNLVESPKLHRTKNGHSVANFRIASTSRRFDRETNAWIDGGTLFVTVTAWRALAENVAQSLHKGQPVIVTGRYYQREYERDETLKFAYELEASAVGHDLTRGVATFEKVFRPTTTAEVEADADGIPADQSRHYLDLADEDSRAAVDGETGEVRELAPAG
jgi:single-strand DNA-binding protein